MGAKSGRVRARASDAHEPADLRGPGVARGSPAGVRPATRWALIVFCVALIVRLVHLLELRGTLWFTLLLGDAGAYDAWARRIAAGDWLGRDVFYQAPLYPYVLAVIYRLFGTDLLIARVWQAVMGSLACALLADAGGRLWSARAGAVAGLMLAFYPPAVFHDALLQKSVLDIFFLCAALSLFARLAGPPADCLPLSASGLLPPASGLPPPASGLLPPASGLPPPASGLPPTASRLSRPGAWLTLGVVMGCLALTRENALALLVPLGAWAFWQARPSAGSGLVACGLLLAGTAAVLTPVAVRNAVVGGEFHLTTSQFGPNFYIGNNPNANGTYQSLVPRRGKADYERDDATRLAERAMGRRLSPGEVSSYFTRQALAYVRAQPRAWARLLGRKFALAWNAVEIADTEDQYTYAEASWPLRLAVVFHFGIVAPLALLGVWIAGRDIKRLWPLYAMLAIYTVTLVLFYVFGRYRLPLVPLLMLLAGAGLARLRDFGKTSSGAALTACAAAVVASAIFCNWRIASVPAMQAVTHFNASVVLENDGRIDEALEQLRTAIRLSPRLASAHNNLGRLLAGTGALDEAAARFERALALDPRFVQAHRNYGQLLLARNELDRAASHFERALAIDATDARTHHDLGLVRARQQRVADAMSSYENALRADPSFAPSHNNLGVLLARSGRLEEAAAHYQQAIAADPGYAEAYGNVGIVLAIEGRLEEAVAQFERALALGPPSAPLHNNLGLALMRGGRLADAALQFERALALDPGHAEARNNLARLRAEPGRSPH